MNVSHTGLLYDERLPLGDDGVAEDADSLDVDLDHVAGGDWPDA